MTPLNIEGLTNDISSYQAAANTHTSQKEKKFIIQTCWLTWILTHTNWRYINTRCIWNSRPHYGAWTFTWSLSFDSFSHTSLQNEVSTWGALKHETEQQSTWFSLKYRTSPDIADEVHLTCTQHQKKLTYETCLAYLTLTNNESHTNVMHTYKTLTNLVMALWPVLANGNCIMHVALPSIIRTCLTDEDNQRKITTSGAQARIWTYSWPQDALRKTHKTVRQNMCCPGRTQTDTSDIQMCHQFSQMMLTAQTLSPQWTFSNNYFSM